MKFKCGPSLYDRFEARHRRLRQWHRWFAWRPVHIAPDICVWLEKIERKGSPGYEGWTDWEYRLG
jgi:hypothetical protein